MSVRRITAHSRRVLFLTADEFDFSLETLWPDGNLISGRLFSGELEQGARLKPRSVCCVTELCPRADRPGHLCRQRALMKCVNGQCTRPKLCLPRDIASDLCAENH